MTIPAKANQQHPDFNSRHAESKLRKRQTQDSLRAKIDGGRELALMDDIAEKAERAYMLGDKDSVPALRLMFDIRKEKLGKVMPDLKSVELGSRDDLPVLILDFGGASPYQPPGIVIEAEAEEIPTLAIEEPSAIADEPDVLG